MVSNKNYATCQDARDMRFLLRRLVGQAPDFAVAVDLPGDLRGPRGWAGGRAIWGHPKLLLLLQRGVGRVGRDTNL